MSLVVNVCPSGIAAVPADTVWQALTTPERFGEWVDAEVVGIRPPGPARAGQRIDLTTRAFGRRWPVRIDVEGVDAERRWIEFRVQLPLGVVNQERITLAEEEPERTLVRFN